MPPKLIVISKPFILPGGIHIHCQDLVKLFYRHNCTGYCWSQVESELQTSQKDTIQNKKYCSAGCLLNPRILKNKRDTSTSHWPNQKHNSCSGWSREAFKAQSSCTATRSLNHKHLPATQAISDTKLYFSVLLAFIKFKEMQFEHTIKPTLQFQNLILSMKINWWINM